MFSPDEVFHTARYLRSDFRRMEHLALLDLPLRDRSVLEVGAGIGDLTSFFLDRGCTVTSTDPRPENVERFRTRYAIDPLWPPERLTIVCSDIEGLAGNGVGAHEVVFCYSVLNQLGEPEAALRALASLCTGFLIVEAGTLSGANRDDDTIEYTEGEGDDPAGSVSGLFCRPTRPWIYNRLAALFPHVYMPLIQPEFDRYRRDWREPASGRAQHRAIFVASRAPMDHPHLFEGIPDQHRG